MRSKEFACETMRRMTIVGVHVVQMRVGWDARTNARRIIDLLHDAHPGDIIVTPEGSVSGYPASGDVGELSRIEPEEVEEALELVARVAQEQSLFVWVGVVRRVGLSWVNEAMELSAEERRTYRKRNLADLERSQFQRGSDLPTFQAGRATVGAQICRELRFPEQWIALASSGAQVLLHLNHAVGAPPMFNVWRSMLVARAQDLSCWGDDGARGMLMRISGIGADHPSLQLIFWSYDPALRQLLASSSISTPSTTTT